MDYIRAPTGDTLDSVIDRTNSLYDCERASVQQSPFLIQAWLRMILPHEYGLTGLKQYGSYPAVILLLPLAGLAGGL